jgi:hypothetical protein
MVISVFLRPDPCLGADSGTEGGVASESSKAFGVLDLHLAGRELISYEMRSAGGSEHILVFEEEFSMSIGANQFGSDKAVVWLEAEQAEVGGRVRTRYLTRAYMQGKVWAKKVRGLEAEALSERVVEEGGD